MLLSGGGAHVKMVFMWRPHMFENASFNMEFSKPFRYKNFGLHMCLTSKSLVSRFVPLLLSINVHFQLRSKTMVL